MSAAPSWLHQTEEEKRAHQLAAAQPPPRRTSFTADELMAMTFPEPRWAVPGVLPEGLTVLAGSPKAGKSWLALNLADAVSKGGHALRKVAVEVGDVLYMALEDPPRRLQERMSTILAGQPASGRLHLATECPRFPDAFDRIDRWMTRHPQARLVIVDVFAKVRPLTSGKSDLYMADYAAVSPLKALADAHGVAVVLLHHTRKSGSEDFLETVSGTHGIAGAADTILVLKRARNAADAILSVTGRDVGEADHALAFDAHLGTWRMLDGPAAVYELADTRRAILAALDESEGLTPKAVAEKIGENYETVKKTLQRMFSDDQVDTDGQGHYFPVPLSLASPVSPDPFPGDTRDRRDIGTGGTS